MKGAEIMDHKEIILKVIERMRNKGETPTKKGVASFLEVILDKPNTYFLMLMQEMELNIEEGV